MSNCRICRGATELQFERNVIGQYPATFRYCAQCDYVFAENPYWLEHAYSDAISVLDTDIVVRNVFTALRLAAIYFWAFEERGQGKYADMAGGYGLLTRLMRDLGFNYYWSDRYATNLFARGFEYQSDVVPCTAISAIEVLEHTVNPLEFLRDGLDRHSTDSILFTTEVFPDKHPPAANQWPYYAFETGQHIAFFSELGLRQLCERLGLRYARLGRIHLATRRDIPMYKLKLASARLLAVPLALAASMRLGSKRNADQTTLMKRISNLRSD